MSRLAPDGMDLEHVSAGGHPALVWNGGRWVLFWERREHTPLATWGECSFGRLALMATEIDASGRVGATREVTPLGPGTWWAGDSCDNHRRGVHAFARGDGFVVAWHERAAASGDTETVYTLVDSALVATTVRRFRSAPWSTPRIGGDAATMAIAWAIDAPVYGWSFARIRADGTRGPAREIFTVASHQIDFGGLAWNGTHFGQAFESDRERLRRCGCEWSGTGHPVEVMLTRLSPDGVPVGGDVVLSEGIEEGMWGMTGVDVTALPGGGFAAAWVGTAAGGSDVAVRLVAADGSRGPLRWVTSDLDARAESTATLVAGPDGLTVAYGHGASSAPWDIRGIRVRRLDAAGAPLGDAVDVVPDTACEPACLQAPWAGPNSGDLRLVSAGGPPGAIYLVWPSAGGQPGTSALHGALVSLR